MPSLLISPGYNLCLALGVEIISLFITLWVSYFPIGFSFLGGGGVAGGKEVEVWGV